ncbi:MAG TPA: hypothetical protein VFI86_01520 [Burkholderiales bacterium]|nr:hypothetical protein [Burkholderiales bacterium]
MNRSAALLAILALGLAGCASNVPSAPERVASNEMPYRPGQGVVIAASQARAPLSAAVGGTASPASAPPMRYRLEVRMNDGVVQYVDTDNADITAGSRVELGADHTIRKL